VPRPDFYLKTGDTDSEMTAVLRDAAYEPVNIENATVKFQAVPIDGGFPIVDSEAMVEQNGDGTDGTMGLVRYVWQAGETDDAGLFLGEWRVVFADTSVQSFPNAGYILIQINESVAT